MNHCTVPYVSMSYQYKALRVQLVKTHTRLGGASFYRDNGGSHTYLVAMVTAT